MRSLTRAFFIVPLVIACGATPTATSPNIASRRQSVPLDAPVPRTFENHGKHDALMVEKAIQLFARR